MSVFIDEMTSEVNVREGDIPLTREQIEALVKLVIRRLEERQRDERDRRSATALRDRAAPNLPGTE
jgi:hypothetical protein